jgi:hypothetical protein
LIEAAEQVEAVLPDSDGIKECVGDKGYHSNQSLDDLEAVGVRSYIRSPIHVGAFNLGLLMRELIGVGTPRGLQGRLNAARDALLALIRMPCRRQIRYWSLLRLFAALNGVSDARPAAMQIATAEMVFTTGS